METHMQDAAPQTPVALGVLTFFVYVAGFATVAAWFALVVLEHPSGPPAARAASSCGACGVVESVRELPAPAGEVLEGSKAEGTIALIAALGRAAPVDPAQRRVYETTVVHDDGAVRVLRDSRTPTWQPGDRVRVLMGRVAPEPKPDSP